MIVVDASVAAKWTIDEGDREQALALVDRADLSAPDVMMAELAHLFRRKVNLGQAEPEQCETGLALTASRMARLIPSAALAGEAFGLSLRLNHSAYDCFYLAVALVEGLLVTADRVFAEKCEREGLGRFVLTLEDFDAATMAEQLAIFSPEQVAAVTRLASRLEQTFDGLVPPSPSPDDRRFTFVPTEQFSVAFDSVPYKRLVELLLSMGKPELQSMLALGWLGRAYYEASDWQRLHTQAAAFLADGVSSRIRYIVAQMPMVRAGLDKLNSEKTKPPFDR